MRNTIVYFFLLLNTFMMNAQQVEKLFGAHTNGSQQVFGSFNIVGSNYSQLSVFNPSSNTAFGETTFDGYHKHYFVKRASTIYILDVLSGNILDSLTNVGTFYNFEYDSVSNSLIGLSVSGGSFVSKSYNLVTKTGSIKTTLLGVDSIVIGESTFDQANRRYFTLTNLGLTAIDSNGVLNDVLCSSPNLFGMEYSPLTNKISYLELHFGVFDFVSIEANICNIEVLASHNTLTSTVRGESTFDKVQGIYYNKTNLGIVRIVAQTGQIATTFSIVNNFGGLEYNSVSATANIITKNSEKEILVSPNPSTSDFKFSNLERGSHLEIRDINGRQIYSADLKEQTFILNLDYQLSGMYFYKIYNSVGTLQTGKLILH